ncbi:MAG: trans-aconitate 2-methyltransferase [Mariniblastus sp.]
MNKAISNNASNHAVKDRELFNRIADKYCKKDLAGSSQVARKHRLIETISVVSNGTANTILEVGCGAGFSADYLKGKYDRFIGVDYADQLIEYAKAHHSADDVEFHASDIRDFVPSQPCDIVVMIGVLHHFDNIPEVMDLIVPMVKPGGWLIANEPQPGNPMVQLARGIRKSVDSGYSSDQVTLSGSDLTTLYKDAGLEEIKIVPQGLLSTPLAEVVLPPQFLTKPLAHAACGFDRIAHNPVTNGLMKFLSWNLVAAGRRP